MAVQLKGSENSEHESEVVLILSEEFLGKAYTIHVHIPGSGPELSLSL
jgi:hypothetical protein